jgi:DNA polymerase III subunit beta
MKFSLDRESLLTALQLVSGVVERRQTLPVLSNVQVVVDQGRLELTGTDLEVEIVSRVGGVMVEGSGSTTIPARKWLDICRSLPDGSQVEISLDGEQVQIRSGRSRFTLGTLPASEFPNVESGLHRVEFSIAQRKLKRMIDRVAFSMAHQDVRYYLNGMLIEHAPTHLRLVATDGHRLALVTGQVDEAVESAETSQFILPRKGVLELSRLLQDSDELVRVTIGSNHLQVHTEGLTYTSKLVDGKFPDYQRVIPRNGTKTILSNRLSLKSAFARAAILSNEKFHGVRLQLSDGTLRITANNPEQEQAEEDVLLDYQGGTLEIGFNVSYLIEALGALTGDDVRIQLNDPNSSALIDDPADEAAQYVVMPMRL